jgi:hypothetical protein
MDTWVKRVWNRNLSAYEIFEASGYTDDPKWPDEPFEKLLEIAFKGKLIDRADHPVILRLRGEN